MSGAACARRRGRRLQCGGRPSAGRARGTSPAGHPPSPTHRGTAWPSARRQCRACIAASSSSQARPAAARPRHLRWVGSRRRSAARHAAPPGRRAGARGCFGTATFPAIVAPVRHRVPYPPPPRTGGGEVARGEPPDERSAQPEKRVREGQAEITHLGPACYCLWLECMTNDGWECKARLSHA